MKIILLQDVAKIGRKGEVKEVSQGYANNFLLRQQLARPATDKDAKAAQARKEENIIHQKVKKELLEKTFADLKGKEIKITEKANEKGHLFSQVHKDKLVKALKEQLNVDIDESNIILTDPIKEVGEKEIILEAQDLSVNIKLVIGSL